MGDRCVLVTVIRPPDATEGWERRSATLVGLAAAVWLAAEIPRTTGELVADIGASPTEVRRACELLVDAGWIVPTP